MYGVYVDGKLIDDTYEYWDAVEIGEATGKPYAIVFFYGKPPQTYP